MITSIRFDSAAGTISVTRDNGAEVTYAVGQEAQYVADTGRSADDFVALAAASYVPAPIATVRAAACAAIDAQAGVTRKKYITDAPGQDATYLKKAADAAAYKLAGYPFATLTDYPWVRAESRAIHGASPTAAQCQTACDGILAEEAAIAQKGADIEEARRTGKIAVGAAQTPSDAHTARDAAIVALVAL